MAKHFRASSISKITLGLAAVVSLGVACKKNEPTASPAVAAATDVAKKDGSASCVTDPRVQPYTANLKVAGNSHNVTFVVVSANPAPPAGGKNTWTVQMQTAAGAPAKGYSLSVSPYMPDHGHGPDTAPTVVADGDNYLVSNIDFFMGGVWRTTLTAKDAQGNIVDAANVFFCVPG